ncbi:MAG: hypothetical protein PHI55_04290 [Burkholderiaceae bacterium]|nr:hypothetical protein [Burkholderiaceae bacterium]
MKDVLTGLVRVLLKTVLMLAGLLVFVSLLAATLLLLGLWGLRALWARLTGRPVTPWVLRVDPRQAFRAARQGGAAGGASAPDVDGAAPGLLARRGPSVPGAFEVTDVEPRDVR